MEVNNWTGDLELILDNIRKNSSLLHEYHRKSFLHLNSQIKYYRIPVLVLSSVASVWSIAGASFMEQEEVSLINCFLGFTASLITSIELYIGIGKQMETEIVLSREYYVLSVDIFKTLSLDCENRLNDGKEYLNECYGNYIKLIERSDVLDKRIHDELMPMTNNKSVYKRKSDTILSPTLVHKEDDSSDSSGDNKIILKSPIENI